ncbi:MAG TPA: (2Fe-2S)-binding protein [Bacillus sp. (in: firmicutes)]|nr:(2Fe-2S)-binding protein [Bacillus sp. (in: firmicutes)]
MIQKVKINLKVNGQYIERKVEPRLLLSDFIRENLLLTGTHIGCEHGVCGACTIHLNGEPVRSCLMLAVQADGCEVKTVESLMRENGELNYLQQAFSDNHALQCGFCTPGFLMTVSSYLEENPNPSEEEIRECISGNLCRCTGYSNIIKAVKQAAQTVSN